MALEGLTEALQKSLDYQATVHFQPIVNNEEQFDNKYQLQTTKHSLPNDCIILYVPRVNSVDGEEAKLVLSNDKSYKIVTETINGAFGNVVKNTIVKDRLCIFRRSGTDKVVLCNAASLDSIEIENAKIGNVEFINTPKVIRKDNLEPTTLVTADELEALKERVSKLENLITFGELEETEALKNAPAGTIYFKLED